MEIYCTGGMSCQLNIVQGREGKGVTKSKGVIEGEWSSDDGVLQNKYSKANTCRQSLSNQSLEKRRMAIRI